MLGNPRLGGIFAVKTPNMTRKHGKLFNKVVKPPVACNWYVHLLNRLDSYLDPIIYRPELDFMGCDFIGAKRRVFLTTFSFQSLLAHSNGLCSVDMLSSETN